MSDSGLRDAQARRGARFAGDGGDAAAHYGDWLAEYWSVRRAAGLLDLSPSGKLAVTGSDRYSWLQGMVSADVRRLEAGEPALDACILDATGHLLTDLRIVNRGDALLLDMPARNLGRMLDLLDGYVIAEDVEIVDQTDFLACFSVQGAGAEVDRARAALAASATVVPADHTGAGGFDAYLRMADAAAGWLALVEAGIAPVGSCAAEVLRIEAGIPLFGLDMDEGTLPPEAGLDATHVSYDKGCYVGQEVLARIRTRGHTNRALTGLLVEGKMLPARGDQVHPDGANLEHGTGRVTSAAHSPSLDRGIALATIRHEHRAPGARLRIVHDESVLSAVATPLPFLRQSP